MALQMARVVPNPLRLHRSPPPTLTVSHYARATTKRRRFNVIACQTKPSPGPTETSSAPTENKVAGVGPGTTPSSGSAFPEFPNKDVNRRIAAASVLAAVGLFVSSRLDFGVSLKDLSASALPYEQALSNGKPTVVEFYADWCEVCRELAPDVYKVEQQYKDRVNFVMLNVDNTKWEQELDEFGVEGIPHFSFLDKDGNEEGNVVGRLPKQYFLENVDALARGGNNGTPCPCCGTILKC